MAEVTVFDCVLFQRCNTAGKNLKTKTILWSLSSKYANLTSHHALLTCLFHRSHISQLCSLADPRLLNKTAFDFQDQYGIKPYTSIRNRFRALVKGEEILKDSVNLKDKVAVVTGANCGLGYRTALHLATRSAHVILACRNLASAEQAMAKIRLEYVSRQILIEAC